MNDGLREDDRRKVTSVGNSWIVCKSKSHPGHVYYFNTLTGEAAWNLSDAEIEKAKSRTRKLERQPGGTPTRCPEPKDQPPSIILENSKPAQRPIQEPFAFNAVTEKPSAVLEFPNFVHTNAPFCNPTKQMSGVMQHTPFNNASALDAICKLDTLNNPVNTLNLNTSTSFYNPKVWDIPQTQQIFISPTIAPLVNHNQAVTQPASGLVFNSIQNASQSSNIIRGTRKFYPRHFNYGQGGQRNSNNKFVFTSKPDLREKLSTKKRFNIPSGSPGVSGVMRSKSKRTDIIAQIDIDTEETHSNHVNDESLEIRYIDSQLHECSSRIDLEPLKRLAPSDSNPDTWFIIVDLDVLLNEFKFLTTLTDSDEQCHLMVPKRVMSQLRDYVTCTGNIQSRRILRFLSHQIEIGYAFMADEPSSVEGDSMAHVIHATCIELSEEKYYLILLSNDNEILSYKDSSSINIYSVDEVKQLLKENTNKQSVSVPNKPFTLDRLINKIKITVPNNNPPQNKESTCTTKDIQLDDHIEDIPLADNKTTESNTTGKCEESVVLKRTVDAGIQTDFEDINASINITNVAEKQDPKVISNSSQNTKDRLNAPEKKREIKLKRSTSNQPSVPSLESNEKRQFKWRRRKNTSPQANEQINSHKDQNTHHKNIESPQTDVLNRQLEISNNNSQQNENKFPDDSIESQESSIYTDQANGIGYRHTSQQEYGNSKENVTIEETSTSGISNTESNIDAESYYSNSTTNQQQLVYNDKSFNKPMYEIENVRMEEYLKMKCDEWVSRFIQIMEEVLSQVLQQDPPFMHSAMPPPWTLHEAAQCVVIKFSNHQDIKDVANKLSAILFQISNAKGNINKNMAPYQYMQMYSYGLYLLAEIMKVTESCEDIQIAMDSLRKLLEDIRNPNIDSSTNDSFNDNLHEIPLNEKESDVPDNNNDSILHETNVLANDNQTSESDNLKPKRRKLSEEELLPTVKFIRNIDQKTTFNVAKNISVGPLVLSHEKQQSTDSHIGEESNSQNTSSNVGGKTDKVEPITQPKIIRNFSLCAEFEEKLKNKFNSYLHKNHDNELDYEHDYGEYITEEYYSEDENENVHCNNVDKTDVRTDINENCKPESPKAVDPVLNNDNSNKFKYMMCMLLKDIKKALCQVRVLCHQCYEELKKPEQSTVQRRKLQQMAERAHLHLIRLCRSLESMLDHETNNPNQNMCNLLKQADINICRVDDRLLFEYRITVAKCKNHVDAFLNSIQNIISSFNN